MRTSRTLTILSLSFALVVAGAPVVSAYWIWTPETKKFINPKYAVKDSPKEQYEWAMSFYDAKDYQRAATEFEKLTKFYEYSEYASKAQYYAGLSYENSGKYYQAFLQYQKTIDNYPHVENVDEIIAREFNIANLYATKENPKLLGADILTSTDRVVEIYKKVVDNAPFGNLADEALFNMGTALKHVERYDEAIGAYQKIVDDYPASRFYDKAQYEVAYCAYRASLKPSYDEAPTERAIKAFRYFTESNKDDELSKEAEATIRRLKEKGAEKSMMTARFYEKIGHWQSAAIYYQDVIDRFPESTFAPQAKKRLDEVKGGKPRSEMAFLSIFRKKDAAVAVAEPVPAKKGWQPISFGKKEPAPLPAKTAPATDEKAVWVPAAQEAAAPQPMPPAAPPAVKEEPAPLPQAPAAPPVPSAEKAAPSLPAKFGVDEKQTVGAVVRPLPATGWTPLRFGSKKKMSPERRAKIKKEWWNPMNLFSDGNEILPGQPVPETAPESAPSPSGWTPLDMHAKTGAPKASLQ